MTTKKNPFIKMAVDTAMFGVGASMIGNASESFKGNAPAQAMVSATGTLYSATYLKSIAGKGKKGLL